MVTATNPMGNTTQTQREGLLWLIVLALVVTIVGAAARSISEVVVFQDFGAEDVLRVLSVLTVIAPLLERAMEVFVGGLRSAEAERLARAVVKAKGDPQALALAEEDEAAYKSQTRQGVLIGALLMGVLIAASGTRALSMLVDDQDFAALPELQRELFVWLDIALTAGLIAGGSEGAHKLTEAFSSTLDSVKRSNQKPDPDPKA